MPEQSTSHQQRASGADNTLRLFIAIELPDEVKRTLRAARTPLEQQRLRVRWVDPDGIHLTLKFLGAVPEQQVDGIVDAIRASAREHQPFTLHTAGIGVFPNARAPRVVWVGVGGMLAELRALQAAIENHVSPLGYPMERRSFSPHLTLGRTEKTATGAELSAIGRAATVAATPPSTTWEVNAVSLMRSELRPRGARYSAIEHIPLHPASHSV